MFTNYDSESPQGLVQNLLRVAYGEAPVAVTLLWGGYLISRDVATAGTVTAVALYVQQMAGPLDELISWLDEIQVGATSLARVIGIADVPADRAPTGEEP